MQKTHIWIAFAVWNHCEESRWIYSLGRNAITSYTSIAFQTPLKKKNTEIMLFQV